MSTKHGHFVVAETVKPGVRVVRFIRPDLGIELHGTMSPDEQKPYQEIRAFALEDLKAGETLVLNFGLINLFPSPFYRILLRLREVVQTGLRANLVLCGLTEHVNRCLEVYKSRHLYTIVPDEDRAVKATARSDVENVSRPT